MLFLFWDAQPPFAAYSRKNSQRIVCAYWGKFKPMAQNLPRRSAKPPKETFPQHCRCEYPFCMSAHLNIKKRNRYQAVPRRVTKGDAWVLVLRMRSFLSEIGPHACTASNTPFFCLGYRKSICLYLPRNLTRRDFSMRGADHARIQRELLGYLRLCGRTKHFEEKLSYPLRRWLKSPCLARTSVWINRVKN